MERIKISLPGSFVFATTIPVRITDINYGGHLGNHVFLEVAHEAREQFLRYYGYSELNFGGAALIMSNAAIEFKSELFYGNEIKISVAAAGFDRLGFDLFYKLEIKAGEEWSLVGKIKTGMSCFDYNTKKIIPVPAEVLTRLHFL